MKFLLDQNVERRLASFLRNLGHDVKVVAIDYPAGIPDDQVLTQAYREKRVVITNDKGDFGELIFQSGHPHAGVILFRRMRSGDMQRKQERLLYVLEAYAKRLNHFLVVTPTNVRVRKTPMPKSASITVSATPAVLGMHVSD
jgi:predicted nuclease of predicted toxin-antitoxin system